MTKHLLGQRQTERMQHDGPNDGMETDNLLADQMDIRGPILLKERIIIRIIAQRIDIVRQRIDPDIDRVLRVKIDRNAPLERRARYAQILQAGDEEVIEHFSGARRRLNEIRMVFDIVDEPILIFGKAEEIAFLARLFDRTSAVWAAAILELQFRPEGLARRTVPALVLALVDIALIVELAENLLNRLNMTLVRRADEVAVINVHQLPQILDARDDMIDILLRGHAGFLRLALDFLTMLIRSGQEKHIIARLLLEARHGIRRSRTIAVTDMQIIARIINRRRNIKLRFLAHSFPLLQKNRPRMRKGDCLYPYPVDRSQDALVRLSPIYYRKEMPLCQAKIRFPKDIAAKQSA